MLQSIGITEWLIIVLVLILLFGRKRIPELFKGLGEAIREFRKAAKDPDSKPKES